MIILTALSIFVFMYLSILRLRDKLDDHIKENTIKDHLSLRSEMFFYKKEMTIGLPVPARKYFEFMVDEGTVIKRGSCLSMNGVFSLGVTGKPKYRKMVARQVISFPRAFIWLARIGPLSLISGSDTESWSRFRILELIPVSRVSDTLDLRKSAFSRYYAESFFWSVGSILAIIDQLAWKEIAHDTFSATYSGITYKQTVFVKVDLKDGRPIEVYFERWTNANPTGEYRYQLFGGKLSNFKNVHGYQVPFRVVACNNYGTDDEFEFFRADVKKIEFI